MKLATVVIIYLLFSLASAAQYQLFSKDHGYVYKQEQPATYCITNKIINLPNDFISSSSFLLLLNRSFKKYQNKTGGISMNAGISIENSTLNGSKNYEPNDEEVQQFWYTKSNINFLHLKNSILNGIFTIQSQNFNGYDADEQTGHGSIEVSNSSLEELNLRDVQASVEFFSNKANHLLLHDSNIYLTFWDNDAAGNDCFSISSMRNILSVTNSYTSRYKYKRNTKGLNFSSDSDTVYNLTLSFNKETRNNVSFRETTFAPFRAYHINSEDKAKTSILFDNCHFGNQAEIAIGQADTLSFLNNEIDSLVFLKVNATKERPLVLMIDRTDLKNVDFDFNEHITIEAYDGDSQDAMNLTFQALLQKYKSEGKELSYQNIDILYLKYKFGKLGFIGKIISKAAELWWNFGYDKPRIVYITLTSLLIFFLFNLIARKPLMDFYPVFERADLNYTSKSREVINHVVVIFVLTLYIFFAVRVDLSKLRPKSTRFIIYFFFQYFFGLFCLLFLFGAIITFK